MKAQNLARAVLCAVAIIAAPAAARLTSIDITAVPSETSGIRLPNIAAPLATNSEALRAVTHKSWRTLEKSCITQSSLSH